MLAAESLAARGSENGPPAQRYVALARFFAENVAVQAAGLERTVTEGGETIAEADRVLLA